jgi:hypothetical protein
MVDVFHGLNKKMGYEEIPYYSLRFTSSDSRELGTVVNGFSTVEEVFLNREIKLELRERAKISSGLDIGVVTSMITSPWSQYLQCPDMNISSDIFPFKIRGKTNNLDFYRFLGSVSS